MHIMGTPQLARILHPFVGVVMFASFIIMFFRYWHHNLINRDDIFWAKNIRKIVVNEVGDTGRYNFGQKCVFWAAIIFLVLLLVSGVIIWRPYFAPAFSIPVIRFALMLHSFAAVALIVVIMVHIYAALWVKGTITAMVEGWVPKRGRRNITRAGTVKSARNRKSHLNEYSHNPAR
jgi:formate dehydrogenase subunit gamma